MIDIKSDVSLKPYNTFSFDYKSKFLVEIHSVNEFLELMSSDYWNIPSKYFVGGGSNILLTEDYDGLFIVNKICGMNTIEEGKDTIIVKVGGGENWHSFVIKAIDNGWGGLENLSLIPGTVGAAPMQNIGAYGVELQDVFVELEAINLSSGKLEVFKKEECEFGYRESVFKKSLKNQYFITHVSFILSKKHTLNLDYGIIKDVLNKNAIESPSIKDVSNAVIQIRQSKLPDPSIIGNSGSFFKNPIISMTEFEAIQNNFPEIPSYAVDSERVKVPAGWLIEKCGWKGYKKDEYGVHEKQALVLVNYGNAKGTDIKQLAKKIQESVHERFSITLIPEVNYIS